MRRRSHLRALVSALCLAACSVELGSQGDVVAVDAATPPAVIAPGGDPSAPHGPSDDGPAADAGALGADPNAGPVGTDPDSDTGVLDAAAPVQEDAGSTAALPFGLGSPDFAAGQAPPELHTCKGGDKSPAFVWQGAPAGTASFALLLTTHTNFLGTNIDVQRWVMWNIPATRATLPAGIEEGHTPDSVPGAIQASNESDSLGGSGGGTLGGWPGSIAGGVGIAGGIGGAGGSLAGGSGGDARQGRRYRGPCSYGLPQTFEFVLYALGETPAPPAWRPGITPDEIATWLTTQATVLGTARLEGVTP